MPGGGSFRQWYAVRDKLKRQGRWQTQEGNPESREGEPTPKRPEGEQRYIGYGKNKDHIFIGSKCWVDENVARYRAKPSALHVPPDELNPTPAPEPDISTPGTPDSLPALESSPTDEGMFIFLFYRCRRVAIRVTIRRVSVFYSGWTICRQKVCSVLLETKIHTQLARNAKRTSCRMHASYLGSVGVCRWVSIALVEVFGLTVATPNSMFPMPLSVMLWAVLTYMFTF